MECKRDSVSARSVQKVIMAQVVTLDDAEERGDRYDVEEEEDFLLELCRFAYIVLVLGALFPSMNQRFLSPGTNTSHS